METVGIFLIVLAAVAALVFGFVYNRLSALDQRCETAFSDVDVQMKHRHSILPGLIETVRGYMGHERAVLENVTRARSDALATREPQARLQAETNLGQSINTLLQVVENYPELKTSSHFSDLRMEIADVENRITAARRFFNLTVEEYNTTLRQFPGNMIGGAFNMNRRQNYDLGVERVLLDEPVAFKF